MIYTSIYKADYNTFMHTVINNIKDIPIFQDNIGLLKEPHFHTEKSLFVQQQIDNLSTESTESYNDIFIKNVLSAYLNKLMNDNY